MDSHMKTGTVYLRPHKAGRKWKQVWLSLLPSSSSGVGRLEILNTEGSAAGGDHGVGLRRHHTPHGDKKPKIVRLSELISVLRLPPNAEACPMENMSAFCVETQDRTMVFAALKDDCVDWVEKLCQNTFQKMTSPAANQLYMEENQIYVTAGEASDFWVVVQRSDAAVRCGLEGSYWLQVGEKALLLKDTQKMNTVTEWPYEQLRRYGNDKLALTIEAGRRCTSGPGTFSFETKQAEKIFSLIQSAIKQKTSSIASCKLEGVVTNVMAQSPLPNIPDMSGVAALLENHLKTSDTSEKIGRSPNGSAGSPETVAPITLMPLPMVPAFDQPSGDFNCTYMEAVYADPVDCIKNFEKPSMTTAEYIDPASILPLQAPKSREPIKITLNSPDSNPCHTDSIYSEVFDKVIPVQNEMNISQSKTKSYTEDEPIYTEPVRDNTSTGHENKTKLDPFAHLYAQVCKKPPSSRPISSSLTIPVTTSITTDPSRDDIIYENLGII